MANLVTTTLKKKLKVLDIASNDGCLLQEFQKFGHDVIGVEPAIQISKAANEKGIPTICEFWGKKAAGQVLERIGKLDIITATNVFAHVDDVHEFVKNVYNILDEDGSFIIEFPYMRNLVGLNEFDTIYHEHLSYFLVKPIQLLLKQHDMIISDISEHEIHGGTIRISAVKSSNKHIKKSLVDEYIEKERIDGLHDLTVYHKLENNAKMIRNEFIGRVEQIKRSG